MIQGVDIVEIARISRLSSHSRFCERVFTKRELTLAERKHAKRRYELLAGRFAAKEAVIKALGSLLVEPTPVEYAGLPQLTSEQVSSDESNHYPVGVSFHDIETLSHLSGAPILQLHGEAKRIAKSYHLSHFHVSLSHTNDLAIAFAILS